MCLHTYVSLCVCTLSRDILTHEMGCPLSFFPTSHFASSPILYVIHNPGKAKGVLYSGGRQTMARWPNSACHLFLKIKFPGTQPCPLVMYCLCLLFCYNGSVLLYMNSPERNSLLMVNLHVS